MRRDGTHFAVRSVVMRASVLLLVGTLVACTAGSAIHPERTPAPPQQAVVEPTPEPTPTPAPTPTPTVYWPLRGTIASDPAAARRRPILVRLGNDPAARPQSGLGAADMVWEMLVEGGITRYMAVFHSQEAPQIGPVRSARLSDLHYLRMLRGALGHVGASAPVVHLIRDAAARGEFITADQTLYPAFYSRVNWRPAPHNVYTSTARLRAAAAAAGDRGNVEIPSLAFASTAPEGGTAATTATIPYRGWPTTYTYDGAANGYRRMQSGARTVDAANNQPVLATNVLVIYTDLWEIPHIIEDRGGSRSIEIRSTGTGAVSIFTNGKRYDGTWMRETAELMYRFVAPDGSALTLQPGQTWVHVIPKDWTVASAP